MPSLLQASFNNGEISPRTGGRVDLAKYASSLSTCLNALPQPHGGVMRRPGTQYIAACKNADQLARLVPFEYSKDQAYVIEFGDQYARFYMDGGQIQQFDAETVFYIQPTGANASQLFTDAATDKPIATYGGASGIRMDDSDSPYPGGLCAHSSGATTAYLLSVAHADWFMDTGAFTVDFWIKLEDVAASQGFFNQYVDANNHVECLYKVVDTFGFMRFAIKVAGVFTVSLWTFTGSTYSADTWMHIAIIRGWGGNVNDWVITVNGRARSNVLTDADPWPNLTASAAPLEILRSKGSETAGCKGRMAGFRVSKGIARWTAEFVPPTIPYPLSGGAAAYEIATTYLESELAALNFCQSADTLYITHPDHAPAKLTRAGHDDWTLATVDFDWPPLLETNETSVTLDADATTGAVSVVASDSLFTADWVGTDVALHSGYFNIATVNDATNCQGNVTTDLTAHTATANWAKSAWDEIEGYPSCVTFFEERLGFAATAGQPQTLWLSVSGDYENFNAKVGSTITDTDACTYTIQSSQVNAIQWLASLKKLIIGTIGGEWLASGNDGPISPSSVNMYQDTGHGCHDLQPVRVGNLLMFVQRAGKNTGKTIREFGYDFQIDSYKGVDLSILAEHLIRNNTIKGIAYQKSPLQILWCIRDDGDLIALTYLREHDVVGWSHHETLGYFESVAVIPGVEEDEVWFIVKRTINGSVVRYIERLNPTWSGLSLSDAFYVDCGLTYNSATTLTISGLTHLEGESVNVLADGIMNTATTVASGAIGVPSAPYVVQVGLPMTTDIETLRCPPVEVQGKKKRISSIVLRLFETARELNIGPDSSRLDVHDVGASLFSGDYEGPFRAGYGVDGKIFIRKSDALPMTLLAAIPELESYP